MLLVFKEEEEINKVNLFIQFDDAEELDKWDLGIYINVKIISSLTKTKRFKSEYGEAILKKDHDQRVSLSITANQSKIEQ